MHSTIDLADAGKLISLALQPKLEIGADDEYRSLVERYCADSDFREHVDGVARGLGIEVSYASSRGDAPGFFIRSQRGSPFYYTLAQFKEERRMNEAGRVKVRGLTALIIVAIAAYIYPKAESLAEGRYPILTASLLNKFIEDACNALKKLSSDQDAKADEKGRVPAWRAYLNEPEMVPSKSGYSVRGRLPMIQATLSFLFERGLLVKVSESRRHDDSEPRYQPHERLRQQILRGSPEELTDLFEKLSELRLAEMERR